MTFAAHPKTAIRCRIGKLKHDTTTPPTPDGARTWAGIPDRGRCFMVGCHRSADPGHVLFCASLAAQGWSRIGFGSRAGWLHVPGPGSWRLPPMAPRSAARSVRKVATPRHLSSASAAGYVSVWLQREDPGADTNCARPGGVRKRLKCRHVKRLNEDASRPCAWAVACYCSSAARHRGRAGLFGIGNCERGAGLFGIEKSPTTRGP